jgi:phospholipase C
MRSNHLIRSGAMLGLCLASPIIHAEESLVQPQPDPNAEIAPYVTEEQPGGASEITGLLRQKIKYVFVIFQENRSFDSYFGTFPGARGLFSQPEKDTPGFQQYILNTDGTYSQITPFRIGQDYGAWDLDDVSHAHNPMVEKMDIVNGNPLMDQFALVEEGLHFNAQFPTLAAKQYGELEMAYVDGDIIPFLWNYASKFVLFDNIFQTIIGPSSPNAIAMIAGQSGSTQWVKHPNTAAINVATNAALSIGVPVEDDPDPLWGSAKDPLKNAENSDNQPIRPADNAKKAQINLTFASVPFTLTGSAFALLSQQDLNGPVDLADLQNDIPYLAKLNQASVKWGWYQEGYDAEPTDHNGVEHTSYIGHHNGPQYFGYIAANPAISVNLHGLNDFFTDIAAHKLGSAGGVFYIRGGFQNQAGLKPLNSDPTVQTNFQGDDDHPGYSDSQLSEALVAREVNAIAGSPYWDQCAIIITYDESEGDYDHVPPQIIAFDPNALALSRGPRIPLLVISPYARAHTISHELGDHNSVIKFIDLICGLTPLQDLPDEQQAQKLGETLYHQPNLGPQDDPKTPVGDLTSAFSIARLKGAIQPLPPSYAEIPDADITSLPHWGTSPLTTHLHITPTDHGRINHIPSDFDPRPSSQPGFKLPLNPSSTP